MAYVVFIFLVRFLIVFPGFLFDLSSQGEERRSSPASHAATASSVTPICRCTWRGTDHFPGSTSTNASTVPAFLMKPGTSRNTPRCAWHRSCILAATAVNNSMDSKTFTDTCKFTRWTTRARTRCCQSCSPIHLLLTSTLGPALARSRTSAKFAAKDSVARPTANNTCEFTQESARTLVPCVAKGSLICRSASNT